MSRRLEGAIVAQRAGVRIQSRYRSLSSALLFCLAVAGAGCGAAPTAPAPPGPPPTPRITQVLDVWTSDGRSLGEVRIAALGEAIALDAATLTALGVDLTSVDAKHFVVRELSQGADLGALVALTSSGRVTFDAVEGRRVLWAMNARNGAQYDRATPIFGGHFIQSVDRYGTVTRLTKQNNPNPFIDVVDLTAPDVQTGLQLLNDAWMVNGVRLGELRWIGDVQGGDLVGGFGVHQTLPSLGLHIGPLFIVHPQWPSIVRRNIAVVEAVEAFLRFDNLFGQSSWVTLFGDLSAPTISAVGADYLRFSVLTKP